MDKTILTSVDGQIMIMGAHRYALGRRTYVVSSMISWLQKNWEYVNDNSRFTIFRDTAREVMQSAEGNSNILMRDWVDFLKWMLENDSKLETQTKMFCSEEYIFSIDEIHRDYNSHE